MSDTATLVTFIIPCYNDGGYLAGAIASVESCSSDQYELIIVDDGSTENNTLEIIEDLQNSGYHVVSQENRGPSAARNAGITIARGKYIVPLDADNKIRPEFVEEAVKILERSPEIAIVHSDFQYFGQSDFSCRIPPFDIKRMFYRNYIDTCAVFRKAVWSDCGGYDEHPSLLLEDWDFWLNAYSRGWKFLHVDIIGFDYAHRKNSRLQKTKLEENWDAAENYVYSKYAMLLKEHYQDYHRWDYHGKELRKRPFRTLFRLFLNAYLPKLHKRMYRT